MIVDDTRVIVRSFAPVSSFLLTHGNLQMGSANINERSLKGDGDSEIALVVDDTDLIQSTMNGEPYMAGRFAASLRRKLFRSQRSFASLSCSTY